MLVIVGIVILIISFIVALFSLVTEEKKRERLVSDAAKKDVSKEPVTSESTDLKPGLSKEDLVNQLSDKLKAAEQKEANASGAVQEVEKTQIQEPEPAGEPSVEPKSQLEPFPWETPQKDTQAPIEVKGDADREPFPWEVETPLPKPAGSMSAANEQVGDESEQAVTQLPNTNPAQSRFPQFGTGKPLTGSFKIEDISDKKDE